jgi:hypothetical protein
MSGDGVPATNSTSPEVRTSRVALKSKLMKGSGKFASRAFPIL